MTGAGFIFRVMPDGDEWVYRRGRTIVGRFRGVGEALKDATHDAEENPPSEVILHLPGGSINIIATFE